MNALIPFNVLWEGMERIEADADYRKQMMDENEYYHNNVKREKDLVKIQELKKLYPEYFKEIAE